jgi:hypothetical protein
MTSEDLTKIAFDISNSLAALNANMESVLEKMADHENRLHTLEQSQIQTTTTAINNNNKNDDFKTELLKLLARAVTIGLVVIGSLSGAGTIIAKMFGA